MKVFMIRLLCLIVVTMGVVSAQTWPSRPIRFISPFAPGGSNDIATRLLAEKLSHQLGQPIVVENKPGANTRIASDLIAKSDPDGYNFLMVAAPHTTNPALYGKLPYDTVRDFTPIIQVVRAPLFLIVLSTSKLTNLSQFVAAPDKSMLGLNVSSPGNGTAPHLALEVFNYAATANLNHIPFKGDSPAVTELLGGRVDAGIHPLVTPLPYIQSGRIRAIAVFGDARSALLPDVPSIGELGYPGTGVSTWFGLVGPAKLPASIVDKLNQNINQILAEPDVKARFVALGMETVGGSPQQFADFIKADIEKWNELVTKRNIKPD